MRREEFHPEESDKERVEKERDILLALLKDAPPRQAIDDNRYWAWKARVDEALRNLAG